MGVSLSAEKISENWASFLELIKRTIAGERKDQLLMLYEKLEDFTVMAPAAISLSNHNCTPGGYIDHILRVYRAAVELKGVWTKFQGAIDFTDEELAFVCINHDLGKLGLPGLPGSIPNDNSWEVEKLGRVYKINTTLPFATVPDRGLFLLQSEGIQVSYNEYLGIKLHDGLYEDANKPYLISYQPESRLRTSLPIIVHQADVLASRVEWEMDWIPKLKSGQSAHQKPVASRPTPTKPAEQALKRLGASNPNILNALKNI